MQCELCGRECDCRPAIIDNVKMLLCPGCIKYGVAVKEAPRAETKTYAPNLDRIKRPPVKDVYKDMNKELVTNWNELIKKAREKKGITREELGFKIGERTVTISKIENGDLKPSDKMIEKLEKELNIKLVEEVKEMPTSILGSRSKGSYTLGDFIKKEE